jgi:hypothetical protein
MTLRLAMRACTLRCHGSQRYIEHLEVAVESNLRVSTCIGNRNATTTLRVSKVLVGRLGVSTLWRQKSIRELRVRTPRANHLEFFEIGIFRHFVVVVVADSFCAVTTFTRQRRSNRVRRMCAVPQNRQPSDCPPLSQRKRRRTLYYSSRDASPSPASPTFRNGVGSRSVAMGVPVGKPRHGSRTTRVAGSICQARSMVKPSVAIAFC